MEREEFLSKFGLGIAAVCVGGCFAACGKSDSGTPTPTPTPAPPAGIKFTANLLTEIMAIGESKSASGIILVRLAAGNAVTSFTAVQRACTHQGTDIDYNAAKGVFVCPNHLSEFSTAGAVLKSPASTNLKKYTIEITGTTLTVVT
jgi:nitrite reductase/ring-hydroxylating ferredoxin subunit